MAGTVSAQPVDDLHRWADGGDRKLGELSREVFAHKPLSRKQVAESASVLESLWRAERSTESATVIDENVIRHNGLELKFVKRVLGERPDDGYSLYISMHGGGNAPARVNDGQWANQVRLYTPKEGIYVAPRAPWNDWNMWFKPGLDELFELLIQAMVVEMGVNPDKVYLLGYSAGGDGVWRMAPRMADRWAAASMMAGHPGEASQVNLRNTPFMIWMGENDRAYNRNRLAVKHGQILDSLQRADSGGYIHETHIVEGKGHWMECADTLAISWMAQHRRTPYPEKIVWRQEEVVRDWFYWLQAPSAECRPKAMAVVQRKGNEIEILECDYSRLSIYLNDVMVDLNRPIIVRYKGEKIFKGKLIRTIGNMQRSLARSGDLRYAYPAVVEVEIP